MNKTLFLLVALCMSLFISCDKEESLVVEPSADEQSNVISGEGTLSVSDSDETLLRGSSITHNLNPDGSGLGVLNTTWNAENRATQEAKPNKYEITPGKDHLYMLAYKADGSKAVLCNERTTTPFKVPVLEKDGQFSFIFSGEFRDISTGESWASEKFNTETVVVLLSQMEVNNNGEVNLNFQNLVEIEPGKKIAYNTPMRAHRKIKSLSGLTSSTNYQFEHVGTFQVFLIENTIAEPFRFDFQVDTSNSASPWFYRSSVTYNAFTDAITNYTESVPLEGLFSYKNITVPGAVDGKKGARYFMAWTLLKRNDNTMNWLNAGYWAKIGDTNFENWKALASAYIKNTSTRTGLDVTMYPYDASGNVITDRTKLKHTCLGAPADGTTPQYPGFAYYYRIIYEGESEPIVLEWTVDGWTNETAEWEFN